MTTKRHATRNSAILEFLGGVFGWIWILGTLVGIGWIIAAAVGDASWPAGIGIVLGAQIAMGAARTFQRATQRTIAAGVTRGEIRIDTSGHARPATPMDRSASRAAIDAAAEWADDVVGKYAALLERHDAVQYFPERELPASKDEVKQALLIAAAIRKAAGVISVDELEIYRTSYVLLMNATSDERAGSLDRAMAIVRNAGGAENLSHAQIREVSAGIATAYRGDTAAQAARDGLGLIAEFDTRLASLLATYHR